MELDVDQEIGRFRVVEPLGRGGQGNTYRAVDLKTGDTVALKSLMLAGVDAWKAIELFEREASVLASIEYPSVPEYIDYIANDDGFFLVQELVEGDSLFEAVQGNRRFSESDVVGIAETLLNVLCYLHSRNPPIVHRDIKPQNVILGADGDVKLVDFGAVKNAVQTTYASTMVGTFGYMAPEQYQGESDERSDLYALGTTLVFLLTGQEPHALPKTRLKVEFAEHCRVSVGLERWLDRMIQPAPEDRFQSAEEALAVLLNPSAAVSEPTWLVEVLPDSGAEAEPTWLVEDSSDVYLDHKAAWGVDANLIPDPERSPYPAPPAGSQIELQDLGNVLRIDVPTASSRKLVVPFIGQLMFTLFWFGFLAFWTMQAASAGIFALFSIPFWIAGLAMALRLLRLGFGSEELSIGPGRTVLKKHLFGWRYSTKESTPVDAVSLQTHTRSNHRNRGMTSVALECGVNTLSFGDRLSPMEQTWLVDVVSEHIKRRQEDAVGDRETEFEFDAVSEVDDVEEVEEDAAQPVEIGRG